MRFLSLLIFGLLSSFTFAELPLGVVDTQPNGDTPLTPQHSLAKITVPDGFKVTLFAGEPDVYQPIAMEFDDRGRLWVVENFSYPDWQSKDQDRILIFEDKDNDGAFDSRKVFAENLSNITGIALGYGGVWCCSTPNFVFIPDRDGDDKPDGPPEVKLDGWNDVSKDIEHNVFNGMTWGPDGWMYGSHGILADSLVGKPGAAKADRQRINCGIWRYHPVSEEFEVVAHGTTNPWGIDFDETGEGFFTNCVIGHLWHLIPGAHYERMYGKHFNPYVFSLIDACSDHLHWGGGHWTDSRGGEGIHSIAGGGHAHVGTMIYLGGLWPREYHGSLFTCNLHGNRINRDLFEPHGSGFTAKHAPDFLMANDPWFRGIAIKYGPDGNVFVSDWTDLGECHDKDGTHRSSGRIYKISYAVGEKRTFEQQDLAKLTSIDLFDTLLKHPNAWQRRHALRILQERKAGNTSAAGLSTTSVLKSATEIATDVKRPKLERLRSMWVIGGGDELRKLLSDSDPHVQAWALRLTETKALVSDANGASGLVQILASLAKSPSTAPNVKLEIASIARNKLLTRVGDSTWELATAMIEGLPEHDDPNLTQMVWYAIEPLYAQSPNDFVRLAISGSNLPKVSPARSQIIEHIVRKTMSERPNDRNSVEAISRSAIETENSAIRFALMSGLRRAMTGRKHAPRPANWRQLFSALQDDGQSNEKAARIGNELAVKFRDEAAIKQLRHTASDRGAELAHRKDAMQFLVENLGLKDSGLSLPTIAKDDSRMLPLVCVLMGKSDGPSVERFLRASMPLLSAAAKGTEPNETRVELRNGLMSAFLAKPERVGWILDAIEAGSLPGKAILPVDAMQIERLENDELNKRLRRLWGVARKSSKEKATKIAEWKRILTDEFVNKGDAIHGRKLFHENCGKCHKLYGEGQNIGPDLTGSDRRNLDYVLQNVIDPSSVVGRDYRLQSLILESGLISTGVIVASTPTAVTIQKVDSRETYPREEIAEINSTRLSLMPEGQFDRMARSDVRDLVLYLRSEVDVQGK